MVMVVPTKVLDGRAAFAFLEDVSVAVTNVPTWTDELVFRYMDDVTTLANRIPAKASLMHFIGGVFGARERKIVVDFMEERAIANVARPCLLTDSALMRGALTAYSWMTGIEGNAFPPRERARACAWITRGTSRTPAEVEVALVRCYALLEIQPP